MLDLLLNGGDNRSFTNRPSGQTHEYYLSGDIGKAEEYASWFDTIRHCGENDTVILYINSGGGNLFTAIQFCSVLEETAAQIITVVEGACMSAATMIFLAGDHYKISPHAMFMLHNYSGGTFGKGGEMYDNIVYERRWSKQFMKDTYCDFLTCKEINAMLDGKDLWLTAEEVAERLVKRHKKTLKDLEALLGDKDED